MTSSRTHAAIRTRAGAAARTSDTTRDGAPAPAHDVPVDATQGERDPAAGAGTAGGHGPGAAAADRHGGIAFTGVSKVFATGRGRHLTAIDDLSFDVRPGEFVSLLGPSGCGKSTAMRMAAALEQPSGGDVRVLGEAPAAVVGAHRLGIAFQDHALLPWLDVRRNVALPFKAVGRRPDWPLVDHLIELVGLANATKLRPRQLSGGMRQRVSIARSLVLQPDVLLLDEPFGALDAVTRRRLNLEVQRIWTEQQTTTLMVTHAVDEAILLSDRIVVMSARPGRVVEVVEVPFERPRGLELLTDRSFHDLDDHLTRALLTADGSTG
jgi:NitT/TauT family transport system ATP-binding protein